MNNQKPTRKKNEERLIQSNLNAKICNREQTELKKADRTVGVNCNIFSNISSGMA